MATLTFAGVLEILNCSTCGQPFAISKAKYDRCRQTGEGFYCPSGHSLVFSETENIQLKQELARAKESMEYLKQAKARLHEEVLHLNYSVRAQKAAKTKIMNRVKHGICPCCRRSFGNLQNHFKTQHPELLVVNS